MCWVRRSFPGIREAGRVGWLTALQRADGPAALQPHTGVKWWPLGWEHRVSSVSAELKTWCFTEQEWNTMRAGSH